jgi:hypothetical protein
MTKPPKKPRPNAGPSPATPRDPPLDDSGGAEAEPDPGPRLRSSKGVIAKLSGKLTARGDQERAAELIHELASIRQRHPETERPLLEAERLLAAVAENYNPGKVFFDEERRLMFLDRVIECGNFERAALLVGVNPCTVRNRRKVDPVFNDAVMAAHRVFVGTLEDSARHLALIGDYQAVYQQGVEVGGNYRRDPGTLQFLLRKHDPAYRDKVGVEHSGGVQVTAGVLVAAVIPATAEEWAADHDAKALADPGGDEA